MDFDSMNTQVRWRIALGGAALVVLTELAIAPETVIDLVSRGTTAKQLGWGGLVALFTAIALLIEGLQIFRNTPHRKRVNLAISRYIVSAMCPRDDCPERQDPSDSIRNGATDVFYTEIDAPSRQVAFSHWAWYYRAPNPAVASDSLVHDPGEARKPA